MYWIEINHEGLHRYRMIKGNDKYVVDQKAFIQKQQWDKMWRKKQEAERKKRERENVAMEKAQKKASAEQQTIEAINQLENIEHIIESGISFAPLQNKEVALRSQFRCPLITENRKENLNQMQGFHAIFAKE